MSIILKKTLPFLIILSFVFLKFQDLLLPYYWDEAWSYYPAIREMASSGPSLVPNSIPPELYRGHPLLFYFLSSSWINIFGNEIWIAKSFSLILAVLTLVSVYFFTKKHFGYLTAILTLLFLSIQSVFFAQATFLLPEIMLTLFTVLSFKFFFDNKKLLKLLFITLTLFTKETGVIAFITLFVFESIEGLKSKSLKGFLGQISYLFIPVILIMVFFIAQKSIVGWYFFPEHISYISIDVFFEKLENVSNYTFIGMGRNLITLSGILAFLVLIFLKKKIDPYKLKILVFMATFILLYVIFSSLNFFTPRYTLTIIPFFLILFLFLIQSVSQHYPKIITFMIFTSLFINVIYFDLSYKKDFDHTLGNRDMIQVNIDMVEFCEEKNLYDKNIFASFLIANNLKDPDLGYLSTQKEFQHVYNSINEETEYAILSNNEFKNKEIEQVKKRGSLLKRMEKNDCWIEIYKMD